MEPETLELSMKRDWNARARENARWYINTLSRDQTDQEFSLSGRREVEGIVIPDLAILTDRRHPGSLRLLEIGCGIGRMTEYLSQLFGEVHAIDVSGEMIRQAEQRLGGSPNVFFKETNGVDLQEFPDDYFDVILSAYVYQHVPSAEIIAANIRGAFRVLKPSGVFKFITNGTEREDSSLNGTSDTWTGASFCEPNIRSLAAALRGQLLSVYGNRTQYCWSMIRKHSHDQRLNSAGLRILSIGRAEKLDNSDFSPRRGDIYLGMILEGIDYEAIDINSAIVEFQGRTLQPIYAGPTAVSPQAILRGDDYEFDRSRVQVSVLIAKEELPGVYDLRVRLDNGVVSQSVQILLPPLMPQQPIIRLVINDVDKGVDIYARGPKSRIIILFEYGDPVVELGALRILVNEQDWIQGESITFFDANGVWETKIQLPLDISDGVASLKVCVGDQVSEPFEIKLRD